jgi:hypothetical protein
MASVEVCVTGFDLLLKKNYFNFLYLYVYIRAACINSLNKRFKYFMCPISINTKRKEVHNVHQLGFFGSFLSSHGERTHSSEYTKTPCPSMTS